MSLEHFIQSPYLIPRGYPLEFLHSIDVHCVTGSALDAGVTKMNKTE